MRRLVRFLLTTVVALFMAVNAASACSPGQPPDGWRDRWIQVNDDGSFSDAGRYHYNDLSGDPIADIGAGRTLQIVREAVLPCGYYESLLFVDCRTAEIVEVLGWPSPVPEGTAVFGDDRRVDEVLAPMGPIDFAALNSVSEVVSAAQSHGIEVNLKAAERILSMRWRNRYDPFNGCKIFYPDSAGANL
ncbi:hypothetical protein [Cognatiyoonia sp. IB215182]|uniref:hypothetical protein n=1 Tax=Cognatiyoonia sp. IB215182 TaxID=3097353 RepID=UPI002A0FB89A|nr:hypothetical protein [Cognatiyoonia sp. IB215182]MDX8352316.1 hypothetical protein [Cognatiyoonia sp. IB215182]